MGNQSFFSPKNKNTYLSVSARPTHLAKNRFWLLPLTAFLPLSCCFFLFGGRLENAKILYNSQHSQAVIPITRDENLLKTKERFHGSVTYGLFLLLLFTILLCPFTCLCVCICMYMCVYVCVCFIYILFLNSGFSRALKQAAKCILLAQLFANQIWFFFCFYKFI